MFHSNAVRKNKTKHEKLWKGNQIHKGYIEKEVRVIWQSGPSTRGRLILTLWPDRLYLSAVLSISCQYTGRD